MTTYDESSGLPTEQHQAPADVPKANPEVPLGSGASDFPIFNPPFTDEMRTYIVKAQFDGFGFVTRGDETHLVIKMKHYVFYDRELGPLNDMQRVDTPDELAELKRKAKEVAADPDDDVDTSGGLFDDAGNVTGDLDAEEDDDVEREDDPAFSDRGA